MSAKAKAIPQTIREKTTVSAAEAGYFFNLSSDGFKKRFQQTNLHRMIEAGKTIGGMRFNLHDVVKAAFPDMSPENHALLVHLFLDSKWRRRHEAYYNRSRAKALSRKKERGAKTS